MQVTSAVGVSMSSSQWLNPKSPT